MPLSDMHPNTASSAPRMAKAPARAKAGIPEQGIAKQGSAKRSVAKQGGAKQGPAKPNTAGRRVRFGTASIIARKPAPAELDRNLEASTEALRRTGEALLRPGVRLPRGRNVPLFQADPERPGHFLRTLNGKTERGVLENGRFTVTD